MLYGYFLEGLNSHKQSEQLSLTPVFFFLHKVLILKIWYFSLSCVPANVGWSLLVLVNVRSCCLC